MAKDTLAAEAKAFAERLKQAMGELGLQPSASVLAHEFNLRYWGRSITVHTARNWLIGASLPMQDKLVTLAAWLKVSPDELRFGIAAGQAYGTREPTQLDQFVDLSDREMLRRYLNLPAGDRRVIREVVGAFFTAMDRQEGPLDTDTPG